ncbi:MAG: ribonuclease III [Microthrixaceae bacterium]
MTSSTMYSQESEVRILTPREQLCSSIGYQFADPELLELSLRHRSWCAENGGAASNERLEFLGDSVLGLIVTDHLFRSDPTTSEGVLARNRSELVSSVALGGVARSVQLGAAMLLGKGEEATGGRDKTSILADGIEAVIGAVYQDGGIAASTVVVLDLLDDRIQDVLYRGFASDHKSQLQELSARRFGQLPRYVLNAEGPEHQKRFRAQVELNGELWGTGEGSTKKEAEQAAAEQAFECLGRTDSAGSPQGVSDLQDPEQMTMASLAVSDRPGAPTHPTETTQGGTHA